jgi:hypothetical protein
MSLPLAILIIFLVVGLCTLVFLALAPSQQIPAPSGRSALPRPDTEALAAWLNAR